MSLFQRIFGRAPGYRCDGCSRWTPRGKGRALVRIDHPGVRLYCPECARVVEAARQQVASAQAKPVVADTMDEAAEAITASLKENGGR